MDASDETPTPGPHADPDDEDRGAFALRTYLGMEMTGDQPGIGIAAVDVDERHLNPYRMVHGAVLFALVDTAMGKATMSVLEEGLHCASIEVSLRFLRPVSTGRIEATTTVLRRGRHVVHLDGRVHDDEGRLVATADGTFAVLGG